MSGRAGRRGKDERGICIIMIDEKVNDSQSGTCSYLFSVFVLFSGTFILCLLSISDLWSSFSIIESKYAKKVP